MSNINEYIEQRLDDTNWNTKIAHNVLVKRKHKIRKTRSIAFSLVAVLLVFVGIIVVNINNYKSDNYLWQNEFASLFYDYDDDSVFSEEIDEFIEESF